MSSATDDNNDRADENVDDLFDSLGLNDPDPNAGAQVATKERVGSTTASDTSKGLFSNPVRWIAALGLGLLVGIGAVLLLNRSSADDDVEAGGDTITTSGADAEADAGADADLESEATETMELVQQLGLDDISVEVRDDKVHLTGTVPSEQDLSALRSAVTSSTNVDSIDMSAVEVAQPAGGPGGPPPGSGGRPQGEGSEGAAGPGPTIPPPPPPGAPPPGFVPPTPEQQANLQAELDRVLAETPLVFDPGSTQMNELQLRVLDTVIISLLEAHPGVPVRLVGYTDETGDEYQNDLLSYDRAIAVSDYLESQGVPGFILRPEGRGETNASGDAGADRRVEIEVITE